MWLWTICALTGNHTSGFRWARWDKVEGRRWFTKYGIGAAGGGGLADGGWRGKERCMPRWSWGKRYGKTETTHIYASMTTPRLQTAEKRGTTTKTNPSHICSRTTSTTKTITNTMCWTPATAKTTVMVYNTNTCKKTNKTAIFATSTTKITKHDLWQSMLIILVCMKNIEYVQAAGGVRNEQQIMMSAFPVGKGLHKNQTIIHVSQVQIDSRVSQFEN